ncbi:MAG: hypothetical protein JO340_20500 [Acidobacteriaceae bacterium]|nr:hypothetical protein [Acidobacteriaceae bacterium]
MARGWESKEIESQIEAAQERSSNSQRASVSPEELIRQRERESVELSRTRVLHDMEEARNPKYREILQRSLQYLDDKIAALAADGTSASNGLVASE